MTKPTRTSNSECPPIRGPQVQPRTVPAVRKDYTINLAAFLLASGKTPIEASKELSLNVVTVRDLFTDPAVIAVADELVTHMKEQFAQKSAVFVQKLISSMEQHYEVLKVEMIPCINRLVEIRDGFNTSDSTKIAAIKELKGWFEAIAKAIMNTKDEQTGVAFTIPMKDLTALIRQDTGKAIDITPDPESMQ